MGTYCLCFLHQQGTSRSSLHLSCSLGFYSLLSLFLRYLSGEIPLFFKKRGGHAFGVDGVFTYPLTLLLSDFSNLILHCPYQTLLPNQYILLLLAHNFLNNCLLSHHLQFFRCDLHHLSQLQFRVF